MDKFNAKGKLIFVLTHDGLACLKLDEEYFLNQYDGNKEITQMMYKDRFQYSIYDLITGVEFYNSVDSGSFIDYDGSIANVFVDGFDSNLGLFHKDLCQGKFIVDGPTWLELCNEHTIEVNWANK